MSSKIPKKIRKVVKLCGRGYMPCTNYFLLKALFNNYLVSCIHRGFSYITKILGGKGKVKAWLIQANTFSQLVVKIVVCYPD